MQTLPSPEQGARLDVFLTSTLGLSRTFVQRAVKTHGVMINGKAIHVPHTFLSATDTVSINWPDAPPPPSSHLPVPTVAVLYQDSDVFVVNKPSGLLVHPAPGIQEATLVDALLAMDPHIASIGDSKERPGIVHRLDRLVSGALVVARTQAAFASLKEQFQNHTTDKQYGALVHGQLVQDSGDIRFNMARNAKGRMVARPISQPGKESHTQFQVSQRYANATHVDINLLTGRTHQIRAHFHALGHAVVGDPLYAPQQKTSLTLSRLWLHAARLSFTSPSTGERVTISSPLPQELANFLTTLHSL